MLVVKKNSKIIKIAVCLSMAIMAIFLFSNFALAANLWEGTGGAANTANSLGLGQADLVGTVINLIKLAIGFLGIIAVIIIIYGGWLWMTSGGEPQKIEQAKKLLRNAVIGLIIIIFSYAIVAFILNLLAGAGWGNQNNPPGPPPVSGGISALGDNIIVSHYPARGQKEVPRNTSIIVTFREEMMNGTICDNGGAACSGQAIISNNIRIYKLTEETACLEDPIDPNACPSLMGAAVYSNDNKTFVFMPESYLGSPTEYIDYAVYLTTEIQKIVNGQSEPAFGSLGMGYEWSFEVSNKVDLTPPQVRSVFPAPDNAKDTISETPAVKAGGQISVLGRPSVKREAAVTGVTSEGGAPVLNLQDIQINTDCQQDGVLRVDLVESGGLAARLYSPPSLSYPAGRLLSEGIINNLVISFPAVCNLVLNTSGGFIAGQGWEITVIKATVADTLTVGNTVYTFIQPSFPPPPSDQNQIIRELFPKDTADNIELALGNNDDVIGTGVTGPPVVIYYTINPEAKLAGAAGDNIELSTTCNPDVLAIAPMSGGEDRIVALNTVGRPDKPMNATIQINFNEAIMPLTVSGTSDEVRNYIRVVNNDPVALGAGISCTSDDECLSLSCQKAGLACPPGDPSCTCVDNQLKGKFVISNQYSTVGFVSANECGVNACGEKIYCLPANSHIRVELVAAELANCASLNNCLTSAPYTICDGLICNDASGKNYPLSALPLTGVADTAANSLDGNRDADADGPVSDYNENDLYGLCASGANRDKQCSLDNRLAVCGAGVNCNGAITLANAQKNGDNYQWSFFISDQLDLTSPEIIYAEPIYPVPPESVGLTDRVLMRFNKLMMSGSLSSGSVAISNGQQRVVHQLINLRPLLQEPLAYWITAEGLDSDANRELDQTNVYINHSDFPPTRSYTAQAGSGVKDIYQNCYLPSKGPACNANQPDDLLPSCCNGTPRGVCP